MSLTSKELLRFKGYCSLYNVPLEVIPAKVWFENCCLDLELFDSLSDKQLEWILNDKVNISEIFFAQNQNRERLRRIWDLLNKDNLERWIYYLANVGDPQLFLKIHYFFVWIYQAEKEKKRKKNGQKFLKKWRLYLTEQLLIYWKMLNLILKIGFCLRYIKRIAMKS